MGGGVGERGRRAPLPFPFSTTLLSMVTGATAGHGDDLCVPPPPRGSDGGADVGGAAAAVAHVYVSCTLTEVAGMMSR